MAGKSDLLSGVRSGGLDDSSQLKINVDFTKASTMGVATSDINAALSTALGGTYVNDFINQGRIKRVYLQGDAPFRMRPDDIGRWQVRNSGGAMVPLSEVTSAQWTFGAPRLERYNGVQATEIQGTAANGVSNGRAMAEVESIIAKLPAGVGYEWSGLSLQERESGAQAPALYALSLVFVFLLLAALYESWSIPFAVILVVPFGVFGAVLATYVRGLDNDIFFQVGLLATMGLAAKNAILIVEFARQLTHGFEGRAPLKVIDATIEAARIRLRPIIMTSLAFTFGILPLVLANSAGARSQHAIGTGLFGGILGATFLAVIFVPLFFVLVQGLFSPKTRKKEPK
jgi:hydrophobe/amphiphile efflux-1 (HAE1) family protein